MDKTSFISVNNNNNNNNNHHHHHHHHHHNNNTTTNATAIHNNIPPPSTPLSSSSFHETSIGGLVSPSSTTHQQSISNYDLDDYNLSSSSASYLGKRRGRPPKYPRDVNIPRVRVTDDQAKDNVTCGELSKLDFIKYGGVDCCYAGFKLFTDFNNDDVGTPGVGMGMGGVGGGQLLSCDNNNEIQLNNDFHKNSAYQCPDLQCPYHGAEEHYHCLRSRCHFSSNNLAVVNIHRRDFHQTTFIHEGYEYFHLSVDCRRPQCPNRRTQNHYHCVRPNCDYTLKRASTMVQHSKRHHNTILPKPTTGGGHRGGGDLSSWSPKEMLESSSHLMSLNEDHRHHHLAILSSNCTSGRISNSPTENSDPMISDNNNLPPTLAAAAISSPSLLPPSHSTVLSSFTSSSHLPLLNSPSPATIVTNNPFTNPFLSSLANLSWPNGNVVPTQMNSSTTTVHLLANSSLLQSRNNVVSVNAIAAMPPHSPTLTIPSTTTTTTATNDDEHQVSILMPYTCEQQHCCPHFQHAHFHCRICQQAFTVLDDIRNHLRRKHRPPPLQQPPPPPSSSLPIPPSSSLPNNTCTTLNLSATINDLAHHHQQQHRLGQNITSMTTTTPHDIVVKRPKLQQSSSSTTTTTTTTAAAATTTTTTTHFLHSQLELCFVLFGRQDNCHESDCEHNGVAEFHYHCRNCGFICSDSAKALTHMTNKHQMNLLS